MRKKSGVLTRSICSSNQSKFIGRNLSVTVPICDLLLLPIAENPSCRQGRAPYAVKLGRRNPALRAVDHLPPLTIVNVRHGLRLSAILPQFAPHVFFLPLPCCS